LQAKARNSNVTRPARQQVRVSANAESTRREAMAVAAGAILLGLTGAVSADDYAHVICIAAAFLFSHMGARAFAACPSDQTTSSCSSSSWICG